ncbi:MAG: tryptophan--tRNA ligase [Thermoplasmatales archaeon]|nr:tryptophan--tRNA ligase [Thermoplasmatales archaeon]
MRIDPWASTQYKDYSMLREQFGIQEFKFDMPDPHKLFRRGIIFGHRGFDSVYSAIKEKKKFAVLTGLVPSGPMHLGHKMTMDQVIYYQSLGADVFITVADIEAFGVRGIGFEKAKEIAINDYVANYIALGLKKSQIYFQSKRKNVTDLAYKLGRKTNLSEMRAIYGFNDSTNMTHVFAPLVQVGDILHVQMDEYGGPRPTVVPVGVDQDPHIRFSRDIAAAHRLFNVTETKDKKIGVFVKTDENVDKLLNEAEKKVRNMGYADLKKIPKYKALYMLGASVSDIQKIDESLISVEKKFGGHAFCSPAATYQRLMTGLTGGKMSSSEPGSAIFLSDAPRDAKKKIKNSKTGGAVSLEEQKKHGGKPEECTVYELLLYHLVENDNELEEIYNNCRSGERMCGRCKDFASQLVEEFLKNLKEKSESAKDTLNDYVVDE